MKPQDIATALQRSTATIRVWSSDFSAFLSVSASGGDGRWRSYNDHDLRVLAVVGSMLEAGKNKEEVGYHLKQLEEANWKDLPQAPSMPPSAMFDVVPTIAAEAALDAERTALFREIAMLQSRIDTLEDQLADEQMARRTDAERLLRENAQTQAALAEAKTLLKLYQEGRLHPDEK